MQYIQYQSEKDLERIIARPTLDSNDLLPAVQEIMNKIKTNGDNALIELTEKFDGTKPRSICIEKDQIEASSTVISSELKQAIELAAANIKKFHSAQNPKTLEVEVTPGVNCSQKAVAIEKVGLYVPGGTAPLFSSVLMLAIPAVLAGCKEIVLCTPPNRQGKVPEPMLYAAKVAGLKKIYCVGGAQAIAAMTFGTETIPKVDKILGPGNQYVTAAKQLAFLQGTAIDMPAGPSEVLVIADETSNPAFVAADLLSQAEHGVDSQVILVCTSNSQIRAINKEIEQQLEILPRKLIATEALKNSTTVLVSDLEEAMFISNSYAPEHLIIASENFESISPKVTNAGSVFLGNLTPESAGDYASGTNHTLPTNMAARAFSGVNMDTFMKKITFQQITEKGVQNIGEAVSTMALNEELQAHANAMLLRLNSIQNPLT
ncbi:MAG: histidinol dehydrogenase [Salinivirgaceae bacterium]|nr:MAG: histidinol dehydrogenase [Salinivirgaceae bacterium]